MKYLSVLLLLVLLLAGAACGKDLDVTAFGAVGDGKTDCTEAFEKAVEAARALGGGNIRVPTGDYVVKGNITLYSGVGLIGTYEAIPTDTRPASLPDKQGFGTVLLAYAGRNKPDDPPFITMKGNNVTLKGVIVRYPEWDQDDIPPVPYPPCVAGTEGNDHNVIDCLFVNPYEALHFDRVGRVYISNVSGYPQKRGLFIDRCYDVSRVENVHFWPFGTVYRPSDPYCAWIRENGVAFEFAKTDWQSCLNTFCYGYGVGYKFSDYGYGGGCGNYIGIGADACATCILVNATRPAGLQITNAQIVPISGEDHHAVLINKDVNDKVTLVNCGFWGGIDKAIEMHAPRGIVSVSDCHFAIWDVMNKNSPCIEIAEGTGLIRGNTFRTDKEMPVVVIGKNALSCVVSDNVSTRSFGVTNLIGTAAVVRDNLPSAEPPDLPEGVRNLKFDRASPRIVSYFSGMYGNENMANRFEEDIIASWMGKDPALHLPVKPNTKYTFEAYMYIPEFAADPENSIWVNGKKICSLDKTGPFTVNGTLRSGSEKSLDVEFRIKSWVPAEVYDDNHDGRTLTGALKSFTLISDKKAPVFILGSGEFEDGAFPGTLPAP
ncbi:MAG: hypothetical protein J5758_06590 [Abditibacteriota bacterium]|nr:hypothetical protein [Abditibacteriota bacterium]